MIDQSTINQTIVGLLLLVFSACVVSILYFVGGALLHVFKSLKGD